MSKQDIVDAHQPDDEIAICREIVRSHQFKVVRELFDVHQHREILDMATANAIVTVYDALNTNPTNQAKFASLSLKRKAAIAWRSIR